MQEPIGEDVAIEFVAATDAGEAPGTIPVGIIGEPVRN